MHTPFISGVWVDIHGINKCVCRHMCVKYNLKEKKNFYLVGKSSNCYFLNSFWLFLIFHFSKWILGWAGQVLWEVLLDLHWLYIFIWRELTPHTCVDFVSSHLSDSNSLSIRSLVFLCGNHVFSKRWQLCLSTFYF